MFLRQEFWRGVRDVVPLAIGVAIYGLAFGLLAAQAGMTELQIGLMGGLVFGGSSQIVAVERLAAGAGATAAIVAGLALNLRLLLVTASIRDVYAERPMWQIALGAHLTADENWALMLSRRAQGEKVGYWYLVGAGALLICTWLVASIAGVTFAAAIPDPQAYGMDFAFTAAFIGIVRSLWRGTNDLLPWITAFAIVVLTTTTGIVDASWSIILGGMAGATAAGLRNV